MLGVKRPYDTSASIPVVTKIAKFIRLLRQGPRPETAAQMVPKKVVGRSLYTHIAWPQVEVTSSVGLIALPISAGQPLARLAVSRLIMPSSIRLLQFCPSCGVGVAIKTRQPVNRPIRPARLPFLLSRHVTFAALQTGTAVSTRRRR